MLVKVGHIQPECLGQIQPPNAVCLSAACTQMPTEGVRHRTLERGRTTLGWPDKIKCIFACFMSQQAKVPSSVIAASPVHIHMLSWP